MGLSRSLAVFSSPRPQGYDRAKRGSSVSDFATDFAQHFEPQLSPVEVLRRPSPADFRDIKRRGHPVLLEGFMDEWPARSRWQDVDYLCSRVGQERVHYRNLKQATVNVGAYREVYEESSFAEFAREVFHDPNAGKYLTQGSLLRPAGWRQAFERNAHPAMLTRLAEDLGSPPFYAPDELYEANLWLGPGGQMSGLHFDEYDNFNCAILGEKRWLLFPHEEHPRLLAGGGFAATIARGFHAGEDDRFAHPERRLARGFQCVTRPGQMLFVPAGCWHQVFSGPSLNMAVNYWYWPLEQLLTTAWLSARRRAGYESRRRHLMVAAAIGKMGLKRIVKYALYSLAGRHVAPPPVGPTGYEIRAY
jgi:hypothetical protein